MASKTARERIVELARQPLIQFVVIGGAIGLLSGGLGDWWGGGAEQSVTITAGEIARLEATWRAQWNRPPTDQELDGLIRAQVREKILYREALAMGLGEDDPVVRRVIVQKLELLYNDLVELSLAPTDQELREYFAVNGDRYRPPARMTVTQVYVDPDKRKARTRADAEALAGQLRELGAPTEDSGPFGDPIMLQSYYPGRTEAEISRLFGAEFAREVAALAPGQWHGPLLSGYGLHVVYVHDRVEPSMPAFETVQDRIRQDWTTEQRRELSEAFFSGLIDRYEVNIERSDTEPPASTVSDSQ